MENFMSKNQKKSGITLTEIMMAMALLATAFIPIIGIMGSSVRVTDKDERTIKVVNLCQEKMNQALQFPFGILEGPANSTKTYGNASLEILDSSAEANKIVLRVGPDSINGFNFKAVLEVADRPGSFLVPMYDPFAKAANPNDPTSWGWSDEIKPYSGMYYQYTMTITWKDKGSNNVEKSYTLSSFKSKVRQ